MLQRNWLFKAVFVALWLVITFGAVGVVTAAPQGVLRIALHAGISADWLDPSISGVSASALLPLYAMHDALVKPMPGGLYTPCLAESWSATPDHKTYDFKLRKGVKFHNGDVMTAEDVIFTFWRYKGEYAKVIQGLTEKLEAVNPQHVRFHFKKSVPDFIEFFAGRTPFGWIVPKKYVEKVGDTGFKKHPIGAGPYKFVQFVPGQRLVMEAFEEFWRKVPNVKRIEFFIVTEHSARYARVKAGDADLATSISGVVYDGAKKDTTLRLLHPWSQSRWYLDMPLQFDPKSPWADVRVRKAASLAIDRKSLAEFHVPGSRAIGTLGMIGDPDTLDIPPDPYDPDQAKKLLAEAGYPKGFHGGKFYPYQGGMWDYGLNVANYWKAVGITTEPVLLDKPANVAMRDGGKMKDGSFIGGSGNPTIGSVLTRLFGPVSYGTYPELKALWDEYQKTVASDKRKDLIIRIQKMIHEKARWLPLTQNVNPAIVNAKVKGDPFKIQPFLWFFAPLEDIELNVTN